MMFLGVLATDVVYLSLGIYCDESRLAFGQKTACLQANNEQLENMVKIKFHNVRNYILSAFVMIAG